MHNRSSPHNSVRCNIIMGIIFWRIGILRVSPDNLRASHYCHFRPGRPTNNIITVHARRHNALDYNSVRGGRQHFRIGMIRFCMRSSKTIMHLKQSPFSSRSFRNECSDTKSVYIHFCCCCCYFVYKEKKRLVYENVSRSKFIFLFLLIILQGKRSRKTLVRDTIDKSISCSWDESV